jgi:hypothetical protein
MKNRRRLQPSCVSKGCSNYGIVTVHLHHGETTPLYSNLCDAEEARKARESADVLAACSICTACRKDDDIRELAGSRCRTEKDEPRRYSERGSATDDSNMLGEVGDEDSH